MGTLLETALTDSPFPCRSPDRLIVPVYTKPRNFSSYFLLLFTGSLNNLGTPGRDRRHFPTADFRLIESCRDVASFFFSVVSPFQMIIRPLRLFTRNVFPPVALAPSCASRCSLIQTKCPDLPFWIPSRFHRCGSVCQLPSDFFEGIWI